eukprot:3198453-Rhodomonas_salina.2
MDFTWQQQHAVRLIWRIKPAKGQNDQEDLLCLLYFVQWFAACAPEQTVGWRNFLRQCRLGAADPVSGLGLRAGMGSMMDGMLPAMTTDVFTPRKVASTRGWEHDMMCQSSASNR